MKKDYYGTYSVRKINKSEKIIHMPNESEGDYAIYIGDNGVIILEPMGKRK
jgi:hypothetical protein